MNCEFCKNIYKTERGLRNHITDRLNNFLKTIFSKSYSDDPLENIHQDFDFYKKEFQRSHTANQWTYIVVLPIDP